MAAPDLPDYNLPMFITGITIASIPIDIVAQTIGNITIDIAAQSLGMVNVNIAASAVVLNVNVTGSVEINIKTTGGANIVIDVLTQAAYLERRSTLYNHGAITTYQAATGANRKGKFFPRGCRGFIFKIEAWCRDSGAAGGTITVYISPYIGAGYTYSANIVVPPGGGAAYRSAFFNIMWNYDSMFIWFLSSTANMEVGYDALTPYDAFTSADAGVSWSYENRRYAFRVIMKAETVGDLPVSGTVNTVVLPSGTSKASSAGTVVPSATPTTIASIIGAGKMIMARIWHKADAAAANFEMMVQVDGVERLATFFYEGYVGTLLDHHSDAIASPNTGHYITAFLALEFKRLLEVRCNQTSGGNVTVLGDLIANVLA